MISNDPYLMNGALRPVERAGFGHLFRYVDGRRNRSLIVALILAALLTAGYLLHLGGPTIQQADAATTVQF